MWTHRYKPIPSSKAVGFESDRGVDEMSHVTGLDKWIDLHRAPLGGEQCQLGASLLSLPLLAQARSSFASIHPSGPVVTNLY